MVDMEQKPVGVATARERVVSVRSLWVIAGLLMLIAAACSSDTSSSEGDGERLGPGVLDDVGDSQRDVGGTSETDETSNPPAADGAPDESQASLGPSARQLGNPSLG